MRYTNGRVYLSFYLLLLLVPDAVLVSRMRVEGIT